MRFDYVFILILPNCACAFREQEDREQALQDLKSGSVKILIATGWLQMDMMHNPLDGILNSGFDPGTAPVDGVRSLIRDQDTQTLT